MTMWKRLKVSAKHFAILVSFKWHLVLVQELMLEDKAKTPVICLV